MVEAHTGRQVAEAGGVALVGLLRHTEQAAPRRQHPPHAAQIGDEQAPDQPRPQAREPAREVRQLPVVDGVEIAGGRDLTCEGAEGLVRDRVLQLALAAAQEHDAGHGGGHAAAQHLERVGSHRLWGHLGLAVSAGGDHGGLEQDALEQHVVVSHVLEGLGPGGLGDLQAVGQALRP